MPPATQKTPRVEQALLSADALAALRAIDFDWTMLLRNVWTDPLYDSPAIHANLRDEFGTRLDALHKQRTMDSPPGWVAVGPAGSGKTHWLSICRRQAVARKMAFILVDLTDVRDFWETVLQGYMDSLQQLYEGQKFQQQILLERFLATLPLKVSVASALDRLRRDKPDALAGDISRVVDVIRVQYPQYALKYQDVIRALIATNSQEPDVASAGLSWLQANPVDEELRKKVGFAKGQERPRQIVQALSWLISLCSPTVLAFDQLDPIVSYLNAASHAGDGGADKNVAVARAIAESISAGFGALRDSTFRTFTVIACLEATWNTLAGQTLTTNVQRYEPPRLLENIPSAAVAESILWPRLEPAVMSTGFQPPDRMWPFSAVLAQMQGKSPRELLKRCDSYRQACIAAGRLVEFDGVSPPGSQTLAADKTHKLDQLLEKYRAEADPEWLLQQAMEDERLGPLLLAACRCLLHEVSLPADWDSSVDDFPGGKTTKPLHARLRLIDHGSNDREQHFCLRAIERENATAFQHRLKGAMTGSGIAVNIPFRRVVLIRSRKNPGGPITEQLLQEFRQRGGLWHQPDEAELRTLFALSRIFTERPTGWDGWLAERRPTTALPLMKLLAPKLVGATMTQTPTAPRAGKAATTTAKSPAPAQAKPPGQARPAAAPQNGNGAGASPPRGAPAVKSNPAAQKTAKPAAAPPAVEIPLGYRTLGATVSPVSLPLWLLEKHTIVLAGAGSGKTVLLKRLVEEAALAGIPSIVLDSANDMAALGDRWSQPPDAWRPGDREKADLYHARTQVIVWTPGRENGNPLLLEPIPDLRAVAGDPDELQMAVVMAGETLRPIVAPGNAETAKNRAGILACALRFLARQPQCNLGTLIAILSELPEEAGPGVANQVKHARAMADALRSQIEVDPMLRGSGTGLDPAVLFGDDREDRPRTRISVISQIGLPSLPSQQQFLNQLAMTLFGWIKQHPRPSGRPLRGLLVIDEAKDFIPSQKTSPCKESVQRLVAQARKYHLGVIFATQNPREIENTVIGNCSTQFYGKASSPAAIETIRDQLQQRGGEGSDVAQLPKGTFYFSNADSGHPKPVKLQTPLCLSRHFTLDEKEVISRANRSREELNESG